MLKKFKENKAQVWVETVVYTLIGLVIISILLSISLPQIQKIKDNGIMKQTINALNLVNGKILEIEQVPGNIRIVEFKISKGKLEINPSSETLLYSLENTRLEFSELGQEIKEGDIFIETERYGNKFNIFLKMNYTDGFNITTMDNKNIVLQAGETPYKIKIENMGNDEVEEKIKIDFAII